MINCAVVINNKCGGGDSSCIGNWTKSLKDNTLCINCSVYDNNSDHNKCGISADSSPLIECLDW